jgi:capsid protein
MSKKRVTMAASSPAKIALGYNSVDDTTRRRKPVTRTTSEISILTAPKREKASATARDDRRNMTILAWMIRRHLDNVSRFTPHIRTGDDKVNQIVKKLLVWHSRARQFDVLGKHGRDEWLRMFEACKVISGDCAGLKSAGGKLQGIEGDRIFRSSDAPIDKGITSEGLVKNDDGTRKEFCVCKRSGQYGNTLMFDRLVHASDMIFDAYWPERFDSDRGVSPLLTALNEGADVRETWEWLVLKAKASALFGLAFTRTGADPMNPMASDEPTSAPGTQAESYSAQILASVKAKNVINLDLDPGDSVTEIESKTPNPAIVDFTRELIRSILLSLDIPFTFYDSLTASFSARIADRNEYEESCEWKREKNISVLDDIYGGWLLPTWAKADLFGFGKALQTANISVEEVAASLRWVPAGRPWLDRAGEMSGHILALAAGTTSIPRICSSYGDDAYEIAAEQKDFLAKCGIPILYAQGGQVPVNDLLSNAIKKGQDDGKTA